MKRIIKVNPRIFATLCPDGQLFRLNAQGQLGIGERCVTAEGTARAQQVTLFLYTNPDVKDSPKKTTSDSRQSAKMGQWMVPGIILQVPNR